jgi:starvation-inducible DNA-binding protein
MPAKKQARPAPSVTVTALQDSLVELIDLSLQAKQYHWNVTGPQFRPVHLQLDEITDAVRLWYDDVAERLAALDVPPDGRASTVVARTSLADPGPGWQKAAAVIVAMGTRLDAIAASLRTRALAIGEDDLISQGMLLEIGAGLEKQAWMLRVQGR